MINSCLSKISVNKIYASHSANPIRFRGGVDECSLGYDIISSAEFPINVLSNFTPCNFELDGVKISSIEAFLQSLKVADPEEQKYICRLDSRKAKGMGKKLNKKREYDFKHLWWQGKRINRESQEYQDLLRRAYEERYKNDEEFRFALEYTKDRVLRHTIGEKDPKRTLLTEKEFTDILMELRDKHDYFS